MERKLIKILTLKRLKKKINNNNNKKNGLSFQNYLEK